jgi:Uncharacterised protein family (UPF0158)
MPPKPRVRLPQLLQAVADPNPEIVPFLDTHLGEVHKIGRQASAADLARFKQASERDPDRFLRIPRTTAEESRADMVAFMATVKDKKLQERLQLALRGGGGLRDYQDKLLAVPAERERWFTFRDGRVAVRLREWLRQSGLEAAP